MCVCARIGVGVGVDVWAHQLTPLGQTNHSKPFLSAAKTAQKMIFGNFSVPKHHAKCPLLSNFAKKNTSYGVFWVILGGGILTNNSLTN